MHDDKDQAAAETRPAITPPTPEQIPKDMWGLWGEFGWNGFYDIKSTADHIAAVYSLTTGVRPLVIRVK